MAAIAACTGGQGSAARITVAAAAEPLDGGVVRLVDSGLSVYPGPAFPGGGAVFTEEAEAADLDYDMVSWGVVVENTSAWVATYTEVRVTLVDAQGATVTTDQWTIGADGAETIVVLLPGQRFGMGHTEALDAPGRHPGRPYRLPTDLRVEIGASGWWPPDPGSVEFAAATTSEVTIGTKPSRIGAGSDFAVSFTIESSYSTERPMSATAVFRNRAGQIIGGTSRWADSITEPGYPGRIVFPGESTGDIRISHTVPDVDDTRSEAYLDPETLS